MKVAIRNDQLTQIYKDDLIQNEIVDESILFIRLAKLNLWVHSSQNITKNAE